MTSTTNAYVGECVVGNRGGRPFIERADETIWVSEDLIHEVTTRPGTWAAIAGDVLTLKGTNTTVRYLLGDPVPGHAAREARRLDAGTVAAT